MNPFKIFQTKILDCKEIQPPVFSDERGRFVKIFHTDSFTEHQLATNFEEEYYSVSQKGVLRGLHFQNPPHAHTKLVTCLQGKILDVVVDLRKSSPTYKKSSAVILEAEKGNMLYVPEGLAHGFYVLSEQCIFLSLNSKKYSAECDSGIRWDSIDFDWPDMQPIVSEKDQNMPPLDTFNTPFKYYGN
jgi:dTDP-4-dehydrorhamnose 3,5-epimerase